MIAGFLVFGLFKLIEVASVVSQLLILKVNYLIDCGIEEVPSMGHDDDCDVQSLNVILKPNQSRQVQMIGGLIEHKNFWLTENYFSNRNSHSPAT